MIDHACRSSDLALDRSPSIDVLLTYCPPIGAHRENTLRSSSPRFPIVDHSFCHRQFSLEHDGRYCQG